MIYSLLAADRVCLFVSPSLALCLPVSPSVPLSPSMSLTGVHLYALLSVGPSDCAE